MDVNDIDWLLVIAIVIMIYNRSMAKSLRKYWEDVIINYPLFGSAYGTCVSIANEYFTKLMTPTIILYGYNAIEDVIGLPALIAGFGYCIGLYRITQLQSGYRPPNDRQWLYEMMHAIHTNFYILNQFSLIVFVVVRIVY